MDYENWVIGINSKDVCERADTIEDFPLDHPKTIIAEHLIHLLNDKEMLVRLAAAETLGCFGMDIVRVALRESVVAEKDNLPKGYMISSLGMIGEIQDLKMLLNMLREERNTDIVSHIYVGIALVSRRIAIKYLIRNLNNESPTTRKSSINELLFLYQNVYLPDVIMAIEGEVSSKEDPQDVDGFKAALSKFKALEEFINDMQDT